MLTELILNIFFLIPNFILSLPFTYFGLAGYSPNGVRAYWQPPGYVFGIVWPILYLLFGIINYRALYNYKLSYNVANEIIDASLKEALGQSLWLSVTSNFGNGRTFWQHFIGLGIMFYLVKLAFSRFTFFYQNDQFSKLLYIPYLIWICFAFILNLQIIIRYFD